MNQYKQWWMLHVLSTAGMYSIIRNELSMMILIMHLYTLWFWFEWSCNIASSFLQYTHLLYGSYKGEQTGTLSFKRWLTCTCTCVHKIAVTCTWLYTYMVTLYQCCDTCSVGNSVFEPSGLSDWQLSPVL